MPVFTRRALVPVLSVAAALAGCGSVDNVSYRIANSITPYKVEVVQGNFVSREQVEALKPGMGRQQVRDILGTPLLADAFHADRWDYVFTINRQGVPQQERRLTVYFKADQFDRTEGDTMPTEAEFVATLDNRRKDARVPVLEATPEQLQKFAAENKREGARAASPAPATVAATATAAASAPAVQRSYPPLEAPAR